MRTPTQQTADYHGNPTGGTTHGRVRVALVGGSGPVVTDDLYRLLRRRLLVLSIFLLAVFAFMTVFAATIRVRPHDAPPLETVWDYAVEYWPGLLMVTVSGVSTWVLWRRPPRTVFGLRVIECVLFGSLVAMQLALSVEDYTYRPLLEAASEPPRIKYAFLGRYVAASALAVWFTLVAYNALIPNTLRRAVLMTVLIALSYIVVFAVFAFWVKPLDPEIATGILIRKAVGSTIISVLVLFATSRIEHFRQQAAEARKLGQYVLNEKLGGGGMGEVYRAEHALLRRPCALKTIRPERAGDPDTLRRFEREVQATAALTHPNTVQVFDYGHAEDGTFYYVMEYLPGLTLEELVKRHGPLPPGRAVHFLRQVCAALGEAHARGLTHRDIKPGNVMICERGGVRDVAKLLDFGLVRMPKDDPDGGTLTRDGAVAGTPAYMSPEQAGGHDGIDPRSDLYSVGALAYFLLTGKPPFADRPPVKMMAAHLYEPPAPLPADAPADLAAVVLRCLAKPPADRWPDAASLEAALAGVSVPPWTPRDAAAWWERATRHNPETTPATATATWA